MMKNNLFSQLLKKGSKVLPVVAFMLLSVAVSVSFGSEGGEGGHEKSVFQAYMWPVINFLLLVGLMAFALIKADVKGYFRKRTELIEQSIREAREAKELAEKALAEVEERLRVKDAEVSEIVSSAKASGEAEKKRIIEESEKLRERILDQARVNIDFEVKKAKASIKEEAVELAMQLAEKKLRDRLTPEEQLKLLEESLVKIEGKN